MLNFPEELYLNGTNFNKVLLSNTSLVCQHYSMFLWKSITSFEVV